MSSYISKLLSSWKLRIKSTGELRITLIADMLFSFTDLPFPYYMPILKIYYHKVYITSRDEEVNQETTILR